VSNQQPSARPARPAPRPGPGGTSPDLNADYTAVPAKCLVLRAIYRVVTWLFLFFMRKHIDRIVGLEHLPEKGPFVIVANHLSYMDDFLLAHAIRLYYGEKLYIPTNRKAFKGIFRSWLHLACGAVEIDPADREGTYRALRRLIADGRIVLVFPEGTRSDGKALLPFKFGAFNLARELGVPLVPVALLDTHRVLPRCRLWPVKGSRASAVMLPPVLPADFERDGVPAVKASCRERLAAVLQSEAPWNAEAAQVTARHLAARAEHLLEDLIERGPEMIRWTDLRPVFRLVELASHSDPGSHEMQVQQFRAWGFRLLSAPRPLAPLLLPRFRALGACALRRDPHQPFVHYVHGQFHLRAPRIVGGSRQRALASFEEAYRSAPSYGIDRTRFSISYAQALARNGQRHHALHVLQRDFAGYPLHPTRLKQRAERAGALVLRLQAAHP
jgi:1-acyl-sn-glycerol-3-phosphate acyltransferase